ncbi:MAG TPA: hypothetical protein PLE74_01395 [Candidatus Cloacimonadota bacterium]|nr:hypothetical protein [Candidatus Cloacimonadota bacterium]
MDTGTILFVLVYSWKMFENGYLELRDAKDYFILSFTSDQSTNSKQITTKILVFVLQDDMNFEMTLPKYRSG